MKTTKKKLRRLQFWSIFLLFAPIIGVIGYNAKDYFSLEKGFVFPQAVEVGAGIVLASVFGVLLALGKTNLLKGNRLFIFLLALSILLKAILNDIILILSAVTLGSIIHSAFQPKILELKEIYKAERDAGIQAKAMKNVYRELEKEKVQIFNGRG